MMTPQAVTDEQETITVPNLPAEEFIALIKSAFTEVGSPLNHRFHRWDSDLDRLIIREMEKVRGKTFRVMQHNFHHVWSAEEGRTLQRAKGFNGNSIAFMVWAIEKKPMGTCISISHEDARFGSSSFDLKQSVLFFSRKDWTCGFHLLANIDVSETNVGDLLLVAFQEI